jgi:hypothetical protein
MHQAIRNAVQQLARAHIEGTIPQSADQLAAWVREIFVEHDLEQVAYSADYFEQMLQHIHHLWQSLQLGRVNPTRVSEQELLSFPSGTVSIRVDLVQMDGQSPQWIRLLSGQEKDDDHLKTRVLLYALAYEALYDTAPNVAIHYSATGRQLPVTPRADVLERRQAKIESLLAGISDAEWQPNRGHHCATCSYNLICPL